MLDMDLIIIYSVTTQTALNASNAFQETNV